MAGRLVKTFEIFPNASLITTEEEKLKTAQRSYTRLHNNVRFERIQRRQLNREMAAIANSRRKHRAC